jgi:NAD(P)-dependent dehydrogenase (short-subunit alcohol dehydrogenase family)
MRDLDLLQKIYLITGASSGIGRQIAIDLANRGSKLLLLDINFGGLIETQQKCESSSVKILNVDVCDFQNTNQKIIESLDGGRLDGFIHCAGMPYLSPLKSLDMDRAMKTYLVNSFSALSLSKICSSHKTISKDGGSFIYVSSIYSQVGSAANVAYAMSKSALTGLVKSLAIELASKKIRVNSVVPGFIETNMLKDVELNFDIEYSDRIKSLHPLGLGKASDISNAVIFLLSDKVVIESLTQPFV